MDYWTIFVLLFHSLLLFGFGKLILQIGELESFNYLLIDKIRVIEEKLTDIQKDLNQKTYDIQEQINESKSEILDTQSKIIKKNRKSMKIIKEELSEVKKTTTDLDSVYSDMVSMDDNFGDLVNQSLQLLGKALKGDSLDDIIHQVHSNFPQINFTKITEIFGQDMELLSKAYKMIHSIEYELSEVSPNFINQFVKRIKYKKEDEDHYEHSDYCPFCLIYDILTELNIYEGIITKILAYVKEYYELLRARKADYWDLGTEEPNFRLFFLYHQNMNSVVDECEIYNKIDLPESNDLGQKVMGALGKLYLK